MEIFLSFLSLIKSDLVNYDHKIMIDSKMKMKVLFPPGEISRIQSWPHGIKLARWRDHDITSNIYNYQWSKIFRGLHLDQGKGS